MKTKHTLDNCTFIIILVAIICQLFSGCATTKGTQFSEIVDLKAKPLSIIVLVPEKNIEFCEIMRTGMLKVDIVDNYYTYEGNWDPAPVISQTLSESITSGFNIKTHMLSEQIDSQIYQDFVSRCESAFNAARIKQKAAFQGAGLVLEFDNSPPDTYLHQTSLIAHESFQKQVDSELAIEISLGGITYYRSGGTIIDPKAIWVSAYGRIIRMSDGKVMRYAKSKEKIQLDRELQSFSDLEKENLKPIKQDFDKIIAKLLKSDGQFLANLLK